MRVPQPATTREPRLKSWRRPKRAPRRRRWSRRTRPHPSARSRSTLRRPSRIASGGRARDERPGAGPQDHAAAAPPPLPAAATGPADATTEHARSVTEPVTAASVAPAPAATAVDSALSERVETLEHGLRRALAEVRQLRDLLGGSSADR